MPSHAANRAAERQEKLDTMHAMVKSGSLTIRQMTEAERKLNPVRTEPPERPPRWRSR
jgi:hypothetical protein